MILQDRVVIHFRVIPGYWEYMADGSRVYRELVWRVRREYYTDALWSVLSQRIHQAVDIYDAHQELVSSSGVSYVDMSSQTPREAL